MKQTILRMVYRHVGPGPITMGSVSVSERRELQSKAPSLEALFESAVDRAISLGADLKEITHAATETAIHIAVQREEGNLQRAAKRLRVTDRMLQIRRARSPIAC